MTKSKKIDVSINKKTKETKEKSIGLCFRCEWRARYFETKSGPRMECGMTTRSSYSCYMYTPVKPLVITQDKGDRRFPLAPWMISARCHATEIANVFLTAKINMGNRKKKIDKFIKYWLPAEEVKPKKRGK